ncbi:methyltransferase, TIGR04325 family [Pseudomonas sp. Fl5BN2]|uniref:methyltransferase, TIGR04325 family n=1 Tax=Pseudomonas sp. Fl5BN2 TaxID=2697652 RepID=UPI001378330C|nr:methyltransferase, TIGR04325 family [Pseudomonas sp. Fl5BN2]NBF03291.1 methyltransferase, TIGR04325 family [Pseudomonas sp. Fl5BN2]
MKRIIKQLIPPIFLNLYRVINGARFGFRGDYSSWQEAENECHNGYAAEPIFANVKQAALKVKAGEFFCERDSVLFEAPQYSWESLACLMHVAARSSGRLNVLDFGGSLGSSYFNNRRFLSGLRVNWSIVEQEHFVSFGSEQLEDQVLHFHKTVDDSVADNQPDVILLSSVLHYLPEPYEWLDRLLAVGSPFILIDRTPVGWAGRDVIKVQKVHPSIYTASYACRILDMKKLLSTLEKHNYKVLEKFQTSIDGDIKDGKYMGIFSERCA